MKILRAMFVPSAIFILCAGICTASDFGPATNALGKFKSIQYERMFTKVPSSGKLVSIKITDSGKTYYICKESSGYVIYHTEIRPLTKFRPRIDKELKNWTEKWDKLNPNDLLLTRDRFDEELGNRIQRYSDVIWIRNEILVEPPKAAPVRLKARAK
jgi:hypothetical protein